MTRVSIIIPCYNEQSRISKLLEAIDAQTFPRQEMEVVIADGMSEDGTRAEISAFAASHPDLTIKVIENPKRIIPSGLNLALHAAQGEIIMRMDGHTLPYPDYVEKSVYDLTSGLGTNVGGICEIRPGAPGWIAAAIAVATAHPIGVGDANYRWASRPGSVDTVPFGTFKRELLATIGFFNETLLTNEDYEFNARIRQTGGIIWFDPAIRSIYFARSTYKGLARQYWRYGYWKWKMLRQYPKTLRWRQGLPPAFVAGLILGLPTAIILPILWFPYLFTIGIYLLTIFIAGLHAAVKSRQVAFLPLLPLAIMIMHLSWGSGFLWSMIGGKE